MHSSQAPQMENTSPDPCNLIVNYIPTPVTDDCLRELFEPFGVVVSARVIVDRATNHPKGYGFVKYTTKEAAKEAIRQMNGYKIQNKHLRVTQANGPQNHSRPSTDSPAPPSTFQAAQPQLIHFVSPPTFQPPQQPYAVLGSDSPLLCAPQGPQAVYSVLVSPPPQVAAPQTVSYVLHSGQPQGVYEHVVLGGGPQQPKQYLLPNGFPLGAQSISCTTTDGQLAGFPPFAQSSMSGQICTTASTPSNCASSQGLTLSASTINSMPGVQNLEG